MKTDLGKVFTVSGEQGLFTYVAQAARGAILESMLTKKRMCAGPSAKMSALSDISIYTTDAEVKLQDVFEGMKKVLGNDDAPAGKSAPEVLKEFFSKALPNYDGDRFYPSHMKKVVEWYNFLKKNASLDFTTEEEADASAKAGQSDAKENVKNAAKVNAMASKGNAKASSKAAGVAKINVPRKSGNS
ncbi:MAG: DUF5606 domain-containing protein [Candidatus Egerieousia sp.]